MLSVICRLCVSQRTEQCIAGRSVPGQDLSLLPTSSPCAPAKPPLGKRLNFYFWLSSVPHPVSLCCMRKSKKQQMKESKMEEKEKKRGVVSELAWFNDGFAVNLPS